MAGQGEGGRYKIGYQLTSVAVFGFATVQYGSGSADPCHGLTDPDPALFVMDLQDFFLRFFCLLLLEGTSTSLFKDKNHKEVKKQEKSKFSSVLLLDDRGIRIQIRTSD